MKNREFKFRCMDANGILHYFTLGEPKPDGIIEQFTGCYDKNGTEIWEGDGLEFETGEVYPPVKFQKGSFGCYTPFLSDFVSLNEINLSIAIVKPKIYERI